MAEQFHTLVFSACGDPDCAIETVNLLSEAQLKRTVYDFNSTASPRATEPAITIRFEDQVGITPMRRRWFVGMKSARMPS